MPDQVEIGPVPATPSTPDKRADYSSVVYFHGMGSQRRYEETSNLIDSLDRYIGDRWRSGKAKASLNGISAKVEPLIGGAGQSDIIGYIETRYPQAPEGSHAGKVKFYEVYWAPVMADQKSPWRVLRWIFAQPLRPWHTLRSPWRERQRLRRASLAAMFETGRGRPTATQDGDFVTLLRFYDDFEGLSAQRSFPHGTFPEFLSFIAEDPKMKPETIARCHALARAWRHAYRIAELRNACILASLALAIVLLGGGVLLASLALLQALLGFAPLASALKSWSIPLAADWKTALAVATAVLGALGVGKFLTDYMGDVEAWATYQETDLKHVARNKAIDCSIEVLTHVLSDEACQRVTLIAHSLGTSIAHDALLALNRRNRAGNPSDPVAGPPVSTTKIEHFITMGSPIDKIEYFFESSSSRSHRYRRVIEELRGDIGTDPFSRRDKPFIHWVNFWDEGDAISGALQSPAGSKSFAQRVDNVHVASYLFPEPGASHAGYFTNRSVIATIFAIVYERALSFRDRPRPDPKAGYDYQGAFIGLGQGQGSRLPYLLMALPVPWFAAIAVIAWGAGGSGLAYVCAAGAVALTTGLGLGFGFSRLEGQRDPL